MRPRLAWRTRETRLTASYKGQKREAFLQIVRSGHRQRKCAQGAQCKAQCASITCCRGRVAMQVNLLAPLLRQSLIRLPTNLGRVTKEKTFERMSFSFPYRGCAFPMRLCYARRTRDTRLTASYKGAKARSIFADCAKRT